jgi:hypothetical protein
LSASSPRTPTWGILQHPWSSPNGQAEAIARSLSNWSSTPNWGLRARIEFFSLGFYDPFAIVEQRSLLQKVNNWSVLNMVFHILYYMSILSFLFTSIFFCSIWRYLHCKPARPIEVEIVSWREERRI